MHRASDFRREGFTPQNPKNRGNPASGNPEQVDAGPNTNLRKARVHAVFANTYQTPEIIANIACTFCQIPAKSGDLYAQ
ncbi:hypothetical protein [Diaphorobacter caeni]|uniref:hypothetical protein n=1 Tax=Diaphorobacter caeni TaxID=2784387 RepID=UPI00189025E8|nr:hypothetical protein [Diaphorobacter caeni]MBF5003225.1 hypothetical protein [Diaphorobacter caeni]